MLKSLRGWSIALVFALVATLLIAMPNAQLNQAEAANAANWDAGNIISDENFYNGRAMTSEAEVQNFLRTKNPGCSSGATCILNYREPTPTMAASAYCNRIEGRANETAASIIHRVGQACNISQMALIVLLEKEQSLITMAAPSATRFARATGYACPDTAPCDAGFGGFFTQVYYGARAYQYYKAHPTQYRHIAGRWNTVLYNPSSSCGSSQVYIQNNATAGLYNYTPYQPNRAALNNLYGVGDSCSAYGNRNFWRLYTDWFGDPRAPKQKPLAVGAAVQSTGTGDYFIYSESEGFVRVPSRDVLSSMGKHRNVVPMSSSDILAVGLSSLRIDGWGMQCGSTQYFTTTQQMQRWESAAMRDHYGIAASDVVKLPADICSTMVISTNVVSQVARDLQGNVYVMQDGVKRPASESALRAAGLSGKFRVLLPPAFADAMPTGPAFNALSGLETGDVVQQADTGALFLMSENDSLVEVEDERLLETFGFDEAPTIVEASDLPATAIADETLSTWVVQCGDDLYAAAEGSLHLLASDDLAAHYGVTNSVLPDDICALFEISEDEATQLVVAEDGSTWVLIDGERFAADATEISAAGWEEFYRFPVPQEFLEDIPVGGEFDAARLP